ncbi:MAG: 3-oxoacyl-ACP synthase [Candidatus Omnitrophota bacterium]|jgi:uncharacterized protein (DUF4415 family)|nr:MAG: 3-oxoacyl-ACP synthase [Candidatus Omnitrophota bacterium]
MNIDLSDIPELDDHYWKNARWITPRHKQSISAHIDKDVLDWFQSLGSKYQEQTNYVLYSYMKIPAKK